MNYAKGLRPSQMREEATTLYGDFFCSEAIVSVVAKHMELDIPSEHLIAMSSGFPGGVGGSKCICGAVSGGVMALGLFFGRSRPGDEKVKHMMTLSAELHDWFKKENGKNSLCCRVLTNKLEWQGDEHNKQCAYFTGIVAEKVALILIRELNLVNLEEESSFALA